MFQLGLKGYYYLMVKAICGSLLNLVVMNHGDVIVDNCLVNVWLEFNEIDVEVKMFDEMLVSSIILDFKNKFVFNIASEWAMKHKYRHQTRNRQWHVNTDNNSWEWHNSI
jgi:hypothetical protein